MQNRKLYLILFVIIAMFSECFSQNTESFEAGAAMYRDLSQSAMNGVGGINHWHAGLFLYFEYRSGGIGRLYLAHQRGSQPFEEGLQVMWKDSYIGTSIGNISALKNEFIIAFNGDGESYHGVFSRNLESWPIISPSTI